jgi:hypothetical protein
MLSVRFQLRFQVSCRLYEQRLIRLLTLFKILSAKFQQRLQASHRLYELRLIRLLI